MVRLVIVRKLYAYTCHGHLSARMPACMPVYKLYMLVSSSWCLGVIYACINMVVFVPVCVVACVWMCVNVCEFVLSPTSLFFQDNKSLYSQLKKFSNIFCLKSGRNVRGESFPVFFPSKCLQPALPLFKGS